MTTIDVDLYRSVRKDQFAEVVADGVPVTGVLYPTFTETPVERNGKVESRAADVTPDTLSEPGKTFIRSGGGTSLFDRANVFGTTYWRSFTIPAGTIVPEGLTVHRQHFVGGRIKARHYQIEATTMLEMGAFKGALDNLARNALVRQLELVGR